MNHEKYTMVSSQDSTIFEFVSTGTKGNIDKLIQFQETDNPLIINLAFGDKKTSDKRGQPNIEIDDFAVSKNGDRDLILSTVAWSVYEYTQSHTEKWIFFAGTTPVKTRLYRMAISKYYQELSKDFHIFGLVIVDGETIKTPFDSSTQFDGFIVKRK